MGCHERELAQSFGAQTSATLQASMTACQQLFGSGISPDLRWWPCCCTGHLCGPSLGTRLVVSVRALRAWPWQQWTRCSLLGCQGQQVRFPVPSQQRGYCGASMARHCCFKKENARASFGWNRPHCRRPRLRPQTAQPPDLLRVFQSKLRVETLGALLESVQLLLGVMSTQALGQGKEQGLQRLLRDARGLHWLRALRVLSIKATAAGAIRSLSVEVDRVFLRL
mmetsp:Transcript_67615/g.156968  ORF Transcript_67615/g.156968 Transcript_67615/m.156968 type:complete len:224 (+) Transcript_67615:871-1542(+)